MKGHNHKMLPGAGTFGVKRLLFIWSELKSSFWFLPVLIILGAIGAAVWTIYLDRVSGYEPAGAIRIVFTGSPASARSVLSTISSAMIGVAGTVFSITLVALTLASSQFGSRLLRNFMHERINQIVLGTYVSTYVYCLIVLNVVSDGGEFTFVPAYSVLAALIATVANIVLLIIYIHHIAVSIQSDKIISDIAESLSENIGQLFPEEMGEEPSGDEVRDLESLKKSFGHKQPVTPSRNGYLRFINDAVLFKKATERDMLIVLKCRPGDYLIENMVVAEICCRERISSEEIRDFQKTFITGKSRTPQQDPEFAIHQMVEIAARALSSGINDPYTAIACIDNLTATMCYLARAGFPSGFRHDEAGRLRIIADVLDFEGMLDAAFDQIRQYSKSSPSVIIRLMEALVTINEFANNHAYKEAIQRHARMVLRMAEKNIDEKNDLDDLRKRSELIIQSPHVKK